MMILLENQIMTKKNQRYYLYPKLWAQFEETFVGVISTRGLGTIKWAKFVYVYRLRFKTSMKN